MMYYQERPGCSRGSFDIGTGISLVHNRPQRAPAGGGTRRDYDEHSAPTTVLLGGSTTSCCIRMFVMSGSLSNITFAQRNNKNRGV
jgi:hypothetical protein